MFNKSYTWTFDVTRDWLEGFCTSVPEEVLIKEPTRPMVLFDPDNMESLEAFGEKKGIGYITKALNADRNKFQNEINAEGERVGVPNVQYHTKHSLLRFPKGHVMKSKDIYKDAGPLNNLEIFILPLQKRY